MGAGRASPCCSARAPVATTGQRPGPGDEHRAGGVVRQSPGPTRAADVPRLPLQGHGGSSGGPAVAAQPDPDDEGRSVTLGPDPHPDPGDDAPLSGAVRLHGPAHEHGYPRDDALTGGDAAGVRRPPGPGSGSVTTRPRSCTPRPGATTWPPGREARHSPTTWTCLAPPTCWATATCCCCARHRFHTVPPADASGEARPGARRDRTPGGQRPRARLRRRRPGLLVAAVRLRPDGQADGVPGARPGLLFRCPAASCFPSRSRPRALRGDHRRGRGTAAGRRRAPLGWAHRLAEFNAAYNPGRTARPPSGSWTGCEACCECAQP